MCKENVICCYECGEKLEEHQERYAIGGEFVCASCFEDYYTVCDVCGVVHHIDDAVYIKGAEVYVCESCARYCYYQCDDCGSFFPRAYVYEDNYGTCICEECYENGCYHTCCNCGEILSEDNVVLSHWGDPYCQECLPEEDSLIRDYHDRPEILPLYASMEDDPGELFGIELEVDDGDVCSDIIETLRDNFFKNEGVAWLSKDGSLNAGFEIDFQPMSYRYFMEKLDLEGVCDVLEEYGFRSHDTSTCGLHIHVDKRAFGSNDIDIDYNLAKLMILFSRFWINIVRFSRRSVDELDQWAKYTDIMYLPEKDTIGSVCEKVQKESESPDRYKAINLTNLRTVEFRFFKGTLKANTIKASVQLIKLFIDKVKDYDLKDITKITWFDFISSDYEELNTYLDERGM